MGTQATRPCRQCGGRPTYKHTIKKQGFGDVVPDVEIYWYCLDHHPELRRLR